MPGTIIRRASKAAVLPAGWLSAAKPSDLVMLLYHRLGEERAEIELPEAMFEEHLRWLAAHATVRSLDAALAADAGGVIITFDDGTRDFYERALPLLVAYRIPALLYLATGPVADGSTTNGELSWSQLEEAVSTGLVTIGSHTHNHADLSKAAEQEAEEEMRRSKDLIEDRLGEACRHFAYPWAVGSMPADRAARRLFDTAALDAWGVNRRGATDPYRLARIPVLRSDGQFFFRAKVRGRLNGEAWLYRAARRGSWRLR